MQQPFWWQRVEDWEASLGSGPGGLGAAEAARRLSQHRPPSGRREELIEAGRQLGGTLMNPLVGVLLVAAAIAAATGQALDAAIIAIILCLSLLLNAALSFRSQRAARALRHAVRTRARVRRDGAWLDVPQDELVPGDVFTLGAGDIVPADALLLRARELHVDQASLTGESLPVSKEAAPGPASRSELAGAAHAVFAGTSVVSGTADALAIRTHAATELGRLTAMLRRSPPPTAFERGMTAFAIMILRLIVALVLLVFLALALRHGRPLEAFLFAVALAVGLTPEFLPMIVTVTLARGALRMARKRVIVKQLAAIENFGSMDVLCCDKTGTLTAGELQWVRCEELDGAAAPRVREAAIRNSQHETGLRSPLEQAILLAAPPELEGTKLDELPFDFHRRRQAVVLRLQGTPLLIAKGAPEAVLEVCSHYRAGEAVLPLDGAARARALERFRQLGHEGLRALALAEREVPEHPAYTADDERELVFLGFAAFRDAPRPEAAATLRALAADGVRVVILTGDHEAVTRTVCAQVGLDSRRVLTGPELERVRPEALVRVVERVNVYARLTPEQKERVVRALKAAGHVVGFLGDGINDAPSLRTADVGISVDGAVDVAREAAPILLLDKSLVVLHQGVREGRRSFANVLKYLMMGTSSNFGNMVSMAAAAVFLPFLPMWPTQILLNNLLYDVSQLALPGDAVEPEALQHPPRWDIGFIQQFMLHLGPLSSVFDLLTFSLLLGTFHATPELFRTGWFVESLLTQTLVVFVIRTRRPLWRQRPARGLLVTVGGVGLLALVIPYLPAMAPLGFVPLPPGLLLAILGLTVAYLAAAELAKRRFYRRVAAQGAVMAR